MKLEHKRLLQAVIPLSVVALLRFGGGVVLPWFGMGWRCGPRNIMDFILIVLLAVAMHRCTKVLEHLANEHPARAAAYSSSALALTLAMFILPCAAFLYSTLGSWHDSVVTQDGYTIVRASNGHGSMGEVRCFLPINSLVHGMELDYDWSTLQVKLPSEI